ncbi:MAG: hypothetical protein ABI869_03610 [Actinomycetota bacterium]
MRTTRIAIGLAAAVVLAAPPVAAAAATPSDDATCVGLASAFFGQQGVRDDVAHAIALRFGIPPGAEVSRFAHVQLGDTAACIANGQG